MTTDVSLPDSSLAWDDDYEPTEAEEVWDEYLSELESYAKTGIDPNDLITEPTPEGEPAKAEQALTDLRKSEAQKLQDHPLPPHFQARYNAAEAGYAKALKEAESKLSH